MTVSTRKGGKGARQAEPRPLPPIDPRRPISPPALESLPPIGSKRLRPTGPLLGEPSDTEAANAWAQLINAAAVADEQPDPRA
ncbi:MAG: hypothetical protein SGPRY_007263 [Prymnesium sp.]